MRVSDEQREGAVQLQFRKVRGGGTSDRVVTHTGSFVFNAFRNRKPMKLLQEGCTVLLTWWSENKTCSSILDFLHWVNNRIRGTYEKGITII